MFLQPKKWRNRFEKYKKNLSLFYTRYFCTYSYIYIFTFLNTESLNIFSVRCVSRSGYSIAIVPWKRYSPDAASLVLPLVLPFLSLSFSLFLSLSFCLSLFAPGSPGSRRGPSEGPRNLEAIRAVQVFEPHTSIPRPGERHLLFWDWAVRNYLPYASPTGPRARRCNQNEWFENSITLITSIKVSIRRGRSFLHSSACLFLSLSLSLSLSCSKTHEGYVRGTARRSASRRTLFSHTCFSTVRDCSSRGT